MKSPIAKTSATLPLFMWPEHAEIDAIEQKRHALHARILRLRWRSQRRIDAEAELRELTHQQLRLCAKLNGKR